VEIGDHEASLAIDDHARTCANGGLKRRIGHSKISTEEGVLKERVLLDWRRKQRRYVHHRRRALADEGGQTLLRRAGQQPGGGRLARADWKHPRYNSADQCCEHKEGEQEEIWDTRRLSAWIGHGKHKAARPFLFLRFGYEI
jgi:hypothetical protein